MRYLFVLIILILSNSIHADEPCKIAEKAMLGAWAFDSGEGFYEEMAFSVEDKARVFNSWLHHRPEIFDASWKLEGCKLTIMPSNGMSNFNFTVMSLKKNKLLLRGEDKEIGQYKRIKTQ